MIAKSTEQASGSGAPTAQQQAYLYLSDEIQSGRLAGGQRVKPEEIAAVLGISRMPVREAIRQLDAEGLLTIRPNRGAIVTVLSPDRLAELFAMRAVLEGLCARWAAARFDEDSFDEIELLLKRMNRTTDVSLWIDRHESFHDFICEMSGRPHAAAEVRKLRAAVKPYLRMSQSRLQATSAEQHQALIDALRSGDPQHAEQIMRAHVDSTVDDLMSEYREQFQQAQDAAAN